VNFGLATSLNYREGLCMPEQLIANDGFAQGAIAQKEFASRNAASAPPRALLIAIDHSPCSVFFGGMFYSGTGSGMGHGPVGKLARNASLEVASDHVSMSLTPPWQSFRRTRMPSGPRDSPKTLYLKKAERMRNSKFRTSVRAVFVSQLAGRISRFHRVRRANKTQPTQNIWLELS
jgi:hypothetical protein